MVLYASRDLGADLKGKFDEKGTAKYWVKIGNNSGNSPEANKDKRVYGLLEFDPSPIINNCIWRLCIWSSQLPEKIKMVL